MKNFYKQTVEKGFTVETGDFSWKGMDIEKVVTFYDKDMKVEAEYFYYKEQCNYLLSRGFEKGSLGESRKRKAHKVNKPFFTLEKGWYGYE